MTQELCGWIDDQEAVQEILACLPEPHFCTAAPPAQEIDILFWEAETKLFGKTLPAHQQTRGTCVSHGWGRGVQDLMLMDIVLRGEPEKWIAQVATEPIYAGARVEVGGGRLRGDGAVGAWAADWVSKWGILLRQKYGEHDLTVADDDIAAAWGAPRKGVPDELEPVARQHPVLTVALVESADEAKRSLTNGYPVPICSNRGFTTTRDARGFCKPRGTWNHCMGTRGYCVVKGNIPAIPIQQSWGESPTGNNRVTLESGREIVLPQGVFLAELDVVDSMLKQGDSFAMSGFQGFPSRKLDHILL